MTHRTRRAVVALGIAGLTALAAVLPALGQTGAAPAASKVDLVARLKEAESDPRLHEAMVKAGRKVAAFCANCHGDGGNSVDAHTPNLAGQNPYYLLQQLREFDGGQRKTTEFKQRLVKFMKPDEKVGMVIFYASQEVAHKAATDPTLTKRGEVLYTKLCADCHNKDGRGEREYSRVAGQQVGYMVSTLKGYRDGTGARINGPMAAGIKSITDADVAAIAAYVSSMK
jgi:cytochrome c553